jgi:hypothetical protein
MRKHKKPYLFDKGKTSGSRRRYRWGGDAYDRNDKDFKEHLEDYPTKEGMKARTGNNLNFSPLKRFLKARVGQLWDNVYSELCDRIPKDIREKRHPEEWYVATKVIIKEDGSVWEPNHSGVFDHCISKDGIYHERWGSSYFVHPVTGILHRLEDQRKRTVSKKEGRTKYAEQKKQSRKSDREYKKKKQEEKIVIGDTIDPALIKPPTPKYW